MWYRKHFHIREVGDRKYFIEWGVQRCTLKDDISYLLPT